MCLAAADGEDGVHGEGALRTLRLGGVKEEGRNVWNVRGEGDVSGRRGREKEGEREMVNRRRYFDWG